jgi:hypothetical protein
MKEKNRIRIITISLIIAEAVLLGLLFSMFQENVSARVGANATVSTYLTVGKVYPEIINVTVNNNAASMNLNPNSTVTTNFTIYARDYDGEDDIQNMTLRFFDNSASSYGEVDDNNNHYGNDSCIINYSYGDGYEVKGECTLDIWYYANNATWNATVLVTDNSSWSSTGQDTITINALLAFAMPDSIDYGLVNMTMVSEEIVANVTNAGNTMANLSLSGYAVTVGDNWAMNCSRGNVQNISIYYEKYLINRSMTGSINYTQFQVNYTNLTSSPVVKQFNLPSRQNDTGQFFDDTNSTYWRIYVPIGVAGSCSGNIVFGATRAAGT